MTSRHIRTVSFIIFLLTATRQINAQSGLSLWYDKPAAEWVEALPVAPGYYNPKDRGKSSENQNLCNIFGHNLQHLRTLSPRTSG